MHGVQSPLRSGFGRGTTASEVLEGVSLRGKTAIVTGGSSGLGLETTRALVEAGAHVIVPARTPGKAAAALATLPGVEQASLDLLEPASIDAFASAFLASGRALHMLVHSAGIMATPLQRDAAGHEAQFSANHLGHFRLAARLWPALRRAEGARVVSVTSRAHRLSPVHFADPDFERRPYDKWKAYGQSKTANALFALELDRRGQPHGVRAFSVHPGTILTDLMRDLTDDDLQAFGLTREQARSRAAPGRSVDEGGDFKTPAQGAATIAWCAASPQLAGMGGVYCEDVDIARGVLGNHAGGEGVRPWATDPGDAQRLWQFSEAATGVVFAADGAKG
jgi:NAD(P)-dependent dehydrogenase (short-subunit alcohol dehydrogenase family)